MNAPTPVLMDITMPRKTGLQALEEILAWDAEAQIIVITALNQTSIARARHSSGSQRLFDQARILRQTVYRLEQDNRGELMTHQIRVLVVDDSLFTRHTIVKHLNADPHITVIGEASNGQLALDKIPTLKPDVITLDVQMPQMDGLTTLDHIMAAHPTPVVMVSGGDAPGRAHHHQMPDTWCGGFCDQNRMAH